MHTARLMVYLRPSEFKKLNRLAEDEGLSRTSYARTILRKEIRKAEEADAMNNRELLRRYADHTPRYSEAAQKEAEIALRKAFGFQTAEPPQQPENKDKPDARK